MNTLLNTKTHLKDTVIILAFELDDENELLHMCTGKMKNTILSEYL